MVIWVKNVQTEMRVGIYSKSLVRAIDKVSLIKFCRTTIKTHKGYEKWPLFVHKQLFWWSTSIKLDNNNDASTDFYPFCSLYTLPHTSVGLTGCISNAFSVLNILTHLTTMLVCCFLECTHAAAKAQIEDHEHEECRPEGGDGHPG